MDYQSMNTAELDDFAKTLDSIPGWSKMKKAEKVAYLESLPQPAPTGTATITITESEASPVVVYVNGRGMLKIKVGVEQIVPVEVVGALENAAGISFTVKGN